MMLRLIKIIGALSVLCFAPAHAATFGLSISPAERDVVIEQGGSAGVDFILNRINTDNNRAYHVSVNIDAGLKGVTVYASDIIYAENETEKKYTYQITCSQTCVGNGDIVVTMIPIISSVDTSASVTTNLAIAQRVHVTTYASGVLQKVQEADVVTALDDTVAFSGIRMSSHRSALGEVMHATLAIHNNADYAIAHLPYTLTILRDHAIISTHTFSLSEIVPAQSDGVYMVKFNTALTPGKYVYRITSSGETYDVAVIITHKNFSPFFIIGSISGAMAFCLFISLKKRA